MTSTLIAYLGFFGGTVGLASGLHGLVRSFGKGGFGKV
jgi:hypothetical protein